MSKRCHHGYNILIMYIVFLRNTVISEDNIAVSSYLNDAMKNILIGRPAIQYNIIFPAAFLPLFDRSKNITSLFKHG